MIKYGFVDVSEFYIDDSQRTEKIREELTRMGLDSNSFLYTVFNQKDEEAILEEGLRCEEGEPDRIFAFEYEELVWSGDGGDDMETNAANYEAAAIAILNRDHFTQPVNAPQQYEYKNPLEKQRSLEGILRIKQP